MLAKMFILASFIGIWGLGSSVIEEKVTVSGMSKQLLRQSAYSFMDELPKYGALRPEAPMEDTAAGTIEVERGFLVNEQKGVLSHPLAEVVYKMKVMVSTGEFQYKFSDVKVYEYARNRYGRYERASSRPLSEEALSKKQWTPVVAQYTMKLQEYASKFKQAMPQPEKVAKKD
jgi:hypothetical protein